MTRFRMAFAAAATLAAAITLTTSTFAKDFKAGDIMIHSPWAKATPKGARVAGGYMKIMNSGKKDDRLIGGTFSKSGKTEVHEMSVKDGVMMMKQLKTGVAVKAGGAVELKPGSFHMMFIGLKEQLKPGDVVKGVLVFNNAGNVEIEYEVKGMKSMKKMDARGSHGGHGMKH